MTLNCGNQFDAMGFAVEHIKSLGLTADDICTEQVLKGFGCRQGVLLIHRIPGREPNWTVAPPSVRAHEAINYLLNMTKENQP